MIGRLATLLAAALLVAVVAAVGGCQRQPSVPAAPEKLSLSGPIGCGHCSFNLVDHCVPVVQTADGTVYVVVAATKADRRTLMAARLRGGTLTVTGTVSVVGGVPTVAVESWQLTPQAGAGG